MFVVSEESGSSEGYGVPGIGQVPRSHLHGRGVFDSLKEEQSTMLFDLELLIFCGLFSTCKWGTPKAKAHN